MLGLIRNELIKFRKKKKLYITMIAFLGLAFLTTYSYYQNATSNYMYNNSQQQLSNLKQQQMDIESQNKQAGLSEEQISQNKQILQDINSQISMLEQKTKKNSTDNWKENLVSAQKDLKSQRKELDNIKESDLPKDQISQNRQQKYEIDTNIKLNQYMIDNNVKPVDESTANVNAIDNYKFQLMALGSVFIVIIIVILSSDVVSGECTPPTMKMLLTKPVGRGKVVFSKFIATVIVALITILGIQLLFFIGIGTTKGFGSFDYPVLVGTKYEFIKYLDILKKEQKVVTPILNSGYVISTGVYLLRIVILEGLFVIAVSAFGLLLSTIIKSSMASTTIGIISVIALSIFEQLGPMKKFAPFLFITYGNPFGVEGSRGGMFGAASYNYEYNVTLFSFEFTVVILILWALGCYVLSHIIFKKRDFLI